MFNKTVSQVLSSFNKIIKELDQIEKTQNQEAQNQEKRANDAMKLRLEALEEANFAAKVRANIQNLIN